jgi:hypothetical protein
MTLKIEATIPQDEISSGNGGAYLAKALGALGYKSMFGAWPVEMAGGYAPNEANPPKGDSVTEPAPAEKPKSTRSSKKAEAPKPAISTGEERIAPEDEATQAQDAADEAAEVKPTGKLTHDDVRQAVARYSKKHGLPAATRDIPLILGCGVADVEDTQMALGNAVEAIDKYTALPEGYSHVEQEPTENAFDDGPAEPTSWTKADVKAAMMAYGEKYDKTSDPNAMAFTKVDVSKIFSKLFGEGVKAFSQVPEDSESCGRAVDAINRAIADDPFQRG